MKNKGSNKRQVPNSIKGRYKLLNSTRDVLKSEFIGLDEIIDKIIECITPWYLTPDVINRPVVVSLWGMTGTGKTSVVRRLIELLRLSPRLVDIDCGSNLDSGDGNSDIESKIYRTFGVQDSGYNDGDLEGMRKAVFVFDEFQHSRTINEDGNELEKKDHRPIWYLMDSGKLSINVWYNSEFNDLTDFLGIFERFSRVHPDFPITNNRLTTRDSINTLVTFENMNRYYRVKWPGAMYGDSNGDYCSFSIPGVKTKADEDEDADDKLISELDVINSSTLFRVVDLAKGIDSDRTEEIYKTLIGQAITAREFYRLLKELRSIASVPREIDCSKSLIFVIGNLDEAFGVSSDIDPDLDADIFYDITKKVKISDIKAALKRRFRSEQIARLGNNIIKYPTLSKENFFKVLDKEVSEVFKRFRKHWKGNISISEEFRQMLFCEGVFPTQGVRPIFTTIETMLTPYLSRILLEFGKGCKDVKIGIKDTSDWHIRGFRIPTTTVTLSSGDITKEYCHQLVLGNDRRLDTVKDIYSTSIHEVGHAILMAFKYGTAPLDILSTTSNSKTSGVTISYDPDRIGNRRYEVEADIMVSLGGYLAEELLIDRPEMRSLGASSDLSNVWDTLYYAVTSCGYFNPTTVDVWKAGFGDVLGFDISDKDDNSDSSVLDKTKELLKRLTDETREVLKNEVVLLKETSKYLGVHGSINGKVFMDFIEKYGNRLTLKYMEEVKSKYGGEYYLKCLE